MFGSLDASAIDEVLSTNIVGRLGLLDAAGRPYVVPVKYVYDGGAIVGYTAGGTKLDALRSSTVVCFEVDDVTDLTNWCSVIAWGQFDELQGQAAVDGFRLIMDAVHASTPVPAGAGHQPDAATADRSGTPAWMPTVYRIQLTESTGRFHRD